MNVEIGQKFKDRHYTLEVLSVSGQTAVVCVTLASGAIADIKAVTLAELQVLSEG